MKSIKKDVVSAILISKDNKVFLCKNTLTNSDTWDIPHGYIPEGDDPFEVLKKQILEQTGIDIYWYDIELVNEYNTMQPKSDTELLSAIHVLVYKIVLEDQEANTIDVNLSEVITQYEWIDGNKLSAISLTPEIKELFTQLQLL